MSKNKLYFLGLITLSIISISFAFFVEYVLGFDPCILCLYQRIPYYLLSLVGIAGFLSKNSKYWVYLSLFIFFSSIILAAYHTGIEREWFSPTDTCNSGVKIPDGASIDEIRELFYSAPIATCTKAAFKVVGISMTEFNLILNICLFLYTVRFIRTKK